MTTANKFHPYHLFMLVLCVYALVVLGVEALCTLDQSTHSILDSADICVCGIFFIDFLVSFIRSENRRQYFFQWGWIDLASSIPTIGVLRWGRAARIMRIFRVLRGVRATKILATFILDRRAEGAFLAAALISILLIISSSISILHFEKDETNANIRSPDDAMWWAITTITTVGYGDKYPVSLEGRIVASILMIAGIGLFGTFSGFVAAWFLKPRDRQRGNELDAIRQQLDEIMRHLQMQAAAPPSRDNG
jgi:voltage-gated potassium channel